MAGWGSFHSLLARRQPHTYYSLLTTHYSLITMLRASANTLEMPSASTCVVRRRCDRLCEIGDVGGASDRLSIGLHSLRAARPKHDRHGPCSVAEFQRERESATKP